MKSIYLLNNKEVFKFAEMDSEKLAQSLGLANSPQISFVQKKKIEYSTQVKEVGANGEGTEGPRLSKLQKLRLKIKNKKEGKKVEEVKE